MYRRLVLLVVASRSLRLYILKKLIMIAARSKPRLRDTSIIFNINAT